MRQVPKPSSNRPISGGPISLYEGNSPTNIFDPMMEKFEIENEKLMVKYFGGPTKQTRRGSRTPQGHQNNNPQNASSNHPLLNGLNTLVSTRQINQGNSGNNNSGGNNNSFSGVRNLKSTSRTPLQDNFSFDYPLQDFGKIRPKHIVHDKEKLYDEIMTLKNKMNVLQDENTKLKSRNMILEKDNNKFEKEIENLEYKGKFIYQNTSSSKEKTVSIYLKKQMKDLKKELETKDSEITKLKKTIKYTRIQEIEVEKKELFDETVRLKNLLQTSVQQNYTQMKQEREYDLMEQKIHQQNSLIESLNSVNQELGEGVKTLEEELSHLQTKHIESEKKNQKKIADLKRALKLKEIENEKLQKPNKLRPSALSPTIKPDTKRPQSANFNKNDETMKNDSDVNSKESETVSKLKANIEEILEKNRKILLESEEKIKSEQIKNELLTKEISQMKLTFASITSGSKNEDNNINELLEKKLKAEFEKNEVENKQSFLNNFVEIKEEANTQNQIKNKENKTEEILSETRYEKLQETDKGIQDGNITEQQKGRKSSQKERTAPSGSGLEKSDQQQTRSLAFQNEKKPTKEMEEKVSEYQKEENLPVNSEITTTKPQKQDEKQQKRVPVSGRSKKESVLQIPKIKLKDISSLVEELYFRLRANEFKHEKLFEIFLKENQIELGKVGKILKGDPFYIEDKKHLDGLLQYLVQDQDEEDGFEMDLGRKYDSQKIVEVLKSLIPKYKIFTDKEIKNLNRELVDTIKTEHSIKITLKMIMKDDMITKSYLKNTFSNLDMELTEDLIDFILIVVIKSRNSLMNIKAKELMKILRDYKDSIQQEEPTENEASEHIDYMTEKNESNLNYINQEDLYMIESMENKPVLNKKSIEDEVMINYSSKNIPAGNSINQDEDVEYDFEVQEYSEVDEDI